ncbi:sensor histidine kinase [uncultured Meiothermus sp.]|uniref:ATP-binding protein n=1 Tax=uncultured Meiothermus sp. TaxID=157471 RepID=UPI002630F8C7|nr:sensor histidine kinase [uncultured Meiothermus sp.]
MKILKTLEDSVSIASRRPIVDFVPRPRPGRRLGIQQRLFLLQVSLFAFLMVILAGIQVYVLQQSVRQEYGERALLISRTVAQIPSVVAAFGDPDPSKVINPLVNSIRRQVGADFIVVGNRQEIRLAHPLPDRLGRTMVGGDNVEPLAGREIINVAIGSMGASIRGKVPVFDPSGNVIGVVSTGYLLPTTQSSAAQVSLALLPWFGLGLVFALISSVWLSRRIKREMWNLEPEQIAALVLQHRSVLSALQEGVLVVDRDGKVQLANPRAAQMLGIPHDLAIPLAVREVWPDLYQSGLLSTEYVENELLRIRTLPVLVGVFRMSNGQHVVTFRDRAEIMQVAEELTQTKRYADLLRAQTHEFMNRLHTIAGLIQLGKPTDALGVIRSEVSQSGAVRNLISSIEVPRLAALIIGKYERARELGIRLELESGSSLQSGWEKVSEALELIVGNLVENAFEAVLEQPRGSTSQVVVMIGEDPEGLQIEVRDNGRGVPIPLRNRMFERGVSSKGEGRGLGLSLAKQQTEGLGGTLQHFNRGGLTVFQVSLPSLASTHP